MSKHRKNGKPVNQALAKVREDHLMIIDEWFSNGFKGGTAVGKFRSELSGKARAGAWQEIINSPKNQAYIDDKRARLRASTDIRSENVLRELINWAYCDATQFMELTANEIKELPEDVRRCISEFKVQKKTTVTRDGREITNEIIQIKIQDKTEAMKNISKHIGFYAEDNEQRQTKINLNKIDANTLNILLQATE